MVSLSEFCSSPIMPWILSELFLDSSASLRTYSVTTENSLPASPARAAAGMGVFSQGRDGEGGALGGGWEKGWDYVRWRDFWLV